MPLSRAIMWVVIFVILVIGAGAYWFFMREFKGQAAETVNIAHTEALTGSSLGLVGYWTFDGNDVKWSDTTTEIKDTSGNSKHGDAQGSLTTTSATAGKTGQALSFNGSSDVASLGNVYNGVKTIAFWAKPNSTTQPFIDLNGTATINMTTGTVAANSFTSPTIYVDGTATSTFPDTNWHHIVVTTGTGINASAVNLGKIASSYFGGILDDVRFYSSTLSSTQVTDLYRASSAKEVDNANHREALTNGLVGYWTFDGRDIKWSDTTTEIKDISGNANHGDAAGSLATTSVLPGKLGQALSFNGTSDYVTVSDRTSLEFTTNQLTLSAWVKWNEFPGASSYTDQTVLGRYDAGSGSRYFLYFFRGGGSLQIDFLVRPSAVLGPYYLYTDYSFNTSQWYFLTAVYNDTNISLFINGTLINSDVVGGGSFTDGSTDLSIGWGAKGIIDDARVYSRALSTTEIMNLYTLGR